MCRFVLARLIEPAKPAAILHSFASMAEASRAPDGDWQGDGWGIAWRAEQGWQRYTSLAPIWEEAGKFDRFEASGMFAIHARSASFAEQRGILEFNQPYTDDKYAFVFNGLLQGVSLAVPGKIGAEKIWNLLRRFLAKYPPREALEKTKLALIRSTREIIGLNIGLCDWNEIYSLSVFSRYEDYYTLHRSALPHMEMIASQPL